MHPDKREAKYFAETHSAVNRANADSADIEATAARFGSRQDKNAMSLARLNDRERKYHRDAVAAVLLS